MNRKDSDELDERLRSAYYGSGSSIHEADKERLRIQNAEPDNEDLIAEGWDALGWDDE